jgi:lysophospholipase L1-like esterase
LKVANRGLGGDVSRGLLFRWKEDVLDLHPRAIILMIGSNDLSAYADPADIEHNIGLMIDAARAQNPKVPIVLCQLTPRNVPDAPIKPGALADINARIARLGAQKQVEVLDLFTPMAGPDGLPAQDFIGKDGIHVAAAGYKVWVGLLRPAFEKLGVQ